MAGRVNFKLTFGGVTHKFGSTLLDEELFRAVKAKVAEIIKEQEWELYWHDGESDVVLESVDDLNTAIAMAQFKTNPSKSPCVHLSVINPKAEEIQKLKNLLAEQEEERAKLTLKLENTQQEFAQFRAQHDSAALMDIEKEMVLVDKIAALTATVDELKAQIATMEEQMFGVHVIESENQALILENEDLESKMQLVHESKKSLLASHYDMENKLVVAKQEKQKLYDEMFEKEMEIDRLSTELQRVKELSSAKDLEIAGLMQHHLDELTVDRRLIIESQQKPYRPLPHHEDPATSLPLAVLVVEYSLPFYLFSNGCMAPEHPKYDETREAYEKTKREVEERKKEEKRAEDEAIEAVMWARPVYDEAPQERIFSPAPSDTEEAEDEKLFAMLKAQTDTLMAAAAAEAAAAQLPPQQVAVETEAFQQKSDDDSLYERSEVDEDETEVDALEKMDNSDWSEDSSDSSDSESDVEHVEEEEKMIGLEKILKDGLKDGKLEEENMADVNESVANFFSGIMRPALLKESLGLFANLVKPGHKNLLKPGLMWPKYQNPEQREKEEREKEEEVEAAIDRAQVRAEQLEKDEEEFQKTSAMRFVDLIDEYSDSDDSNCNCDEETDTDDDDEEKEEVEEKEEDETQDEGEDDVEEVKEKKAKEVDSTITFPALVLNAAALLSVAQPVQPTPYELQQAQLQQQLCDAAEEKERKIAAKIHEMKTVPFWERMALLSVKMESIGEKMAKLEERVEQIEDEDDDDIVFEDRVDEMEDRLAKAEERAEEKREVDM